MAYVLLYDSGMMHGALCVAFDTVLGILLSCIEGFALPKLQKSFYRLSRLFKPVHPESSRAAKVGRSFLFLSFFLMFCELMLCSIELQPYTFEHEVSSGTPSSLQFFTYICCSKVFINKDEEEYARLELD